MGKYNQFGGKFKKYGDLRGKFRNMKDLRGKYEINPKKLKKKIR